MNPKSKGAPRSGSHVKTVTVGFRVTADQLERLERKASLEGFPSPGKLAEFVVFSFLDGPDENSVPRNLAAIRKQLADFRYDILNVARYIIAVQDSENRSEERDAEIERGLKEVMGLPN